ncbi:MAG TPA: choice-of-anchor Q domain-containing protein [Candidatus Acidoferrum sp.]|nr:choice-of-anchor Q domain-containing protein [Candidatus Acidoferrum sp.]
MKRLLLQLAAVGTLTFHLNTSATVRYVDLNCANPVPPYTDWSSAATNIQDAVDAAADGDQVLATNGVYQTGGTMTDMTNRVTVIKPITVQSVNGPAVTVIRGFQAPGTITGAGAVRGVYLAGGALLSGFTVTGGGANNYAAGIYCASASEIITNCVVTGNNSGAYAGGVYYGTLYNCVVSQNAAISDGGGCYHSHLYNCLIATNTANNGGGIGYGFLDNCVLAGNFARTSGGGTFLASSLRNCTLTGNRAKLQGGGAYGTGATYQNCIIYYNYLAAGGSPFTNVYDSGPDIKNCCLTPRLVGGNGNLTNPPVFLDSAGGNYRLHLGSPCIDAGTNSVVYWSTDMDGNPRIVAGTVDIGAYENQYTGTVHYVSLTSTNPLSPYTNWATAATNIQSAVAVALDGETVVAGDGTYSVGSVTVYGSEANRVALTNGITLVSLNGSKATRIAGDTQTRCVYVGSNATLSGFTLIYGQTRSSGDPVREQSGGGGWCESSNSVVADCLITNCTAWQNGGGVFGGTLYRCTVAGNMANNSGGGAFSNTAWDCALVNNWATSAGGGAASASLFNCLIASNNYSSGGYANGAGVYQGTLSNCTLIANGKIYGTSGGGAYRSTLFRCLLLTNYSTYGPGGAQYSELHECTLMGNQGSSGGGTYQCTNYNCALLGNLGSGGGMYGGISYNCLVISNTSASQGGGASWATLYNCTVVGNTATNGGGGVNASSLYNCIVYSNSAPTGSNWLASSLIYNCCTIPAPSGYGNITNAPSFVNAPAGDFRLRCGSPGINAGNNSYVTVATDFNGNPRITGGAVDMGACEFNPIQDLVPQIRKSFNFDNFAAGYPVSFAGLVAGCPDYLWWDFGDGITVTNQAAASHAWAGPGTFDVVLTAYSASLGYGLSATTRVQVVQQPVYYVDANSPGPVTPYNSWSTAARSIQDGIYAGNTPGRLVLVTNGMYYGQVGGAIQWKNVMLTNIVVVQSVNGPGATIINNYYPYRVACVGNYSVLDGFTVTGGSASSGTNLYQDQCGGGLWCESNGMVTNCTITGNTAGYGGGGAYQGIFYNCVFTNNSVPNLNTNGGGGGGAYSGTFYNCLFISNTVAGAPDFGGGGATCQSVLYNSFVLGNQALNMVRGGGCYGSVLSNCVVMYNQDLNYNGGGVSYSTLYDCTVCSNTASRGGGGASSTFWNCLLIENCATNGGATAWSSLHNCLVVSNLAANYAGGVYNGSNCYNCTVVKNTAYRGGGLYGTTYPCLIFNSIIFGNTASSVSQDWEGLVQSYDSCSIPRLNPTSPSYGNITNDPVFVDAGFHLSAASPCRGAGSPLFVSGTDLDGEAWNSPPSMGADEVYDADFAGALTVLIQAGQTDVLVNRSLGLAGQVTGRAARLDWSFGDGTTLSNANFFTSHSWTNPGDYSVTLTAYNADYPGGVSTDLWIHVQPLKPPLLQPTSFSSSPGNGFEFQFAGQSNAIYTVQNATNLAPPVVWQDLQTLVSTGGVVRVRDTNATWGTSFYRVGVQ